MNPQEIFETVLRHLQTQNWIRSTRTSNMQCAYRGLKARKCAIGCLIPDEVYDPKMEGNTVWSLLERFPTSLPSYFKEHEALLGDLQELHDSMNYPLDTHQLAVCWTFSKVRKIAQKHGLDVPDWLDYSQKP